ncbi:restriction endonuclease subunit S [Microcoleus sp. OTE_8_concoct_300]|uniref:restriction endonuclease subunit S n=1 Tax=Microcoleus sp. OTE_8_concoct_300 TaxID=2964710 RepID=UPI00403F5EF0
MKIERYKAYKDSEVKCIGEIPEHWESGMLNRIARRVVVGIAEAATHAYAEEGTPILRSTNIRAGKIIGDIFYINSDFANDRKSKLIHAGDLVTVRTGNVGVTAVVPEELDKCQCFTMLVTTLVTKLASISYYCYWINSISAQDYFYLEGWGTAQLNISVPILQALPIPIPSLSEQEAIAHYLDTKTDQIDRKIDLLTQKAALYGDLKQSLINETVTRGLDKSVPVKDSGAEWLGEVPEHWQITFLVKTLSSLVDYRGRTPRKVNIDENGILLVTARNIKQGRIDYSLSEEFVDIDDVQSLLNRGKPEIGDVLFTTEAPLGEVANVDRLHFALAQRIIKFRGKINTLDNYFMKYWLMSSVFQYSLQRNATGSTVLGLKGSKVRLLSIVLPPLSEQKAIADYLDTKTAQIDQIIQTINTQIEKLKELRKTLLNDVVTGKIKVV